MKTKLLAKRRDSRGLIEAINSRKRIRDYKPKRADYPEPVRQIACTPEFKKLAIALAIGYPDWDFPASKLQSTRQPLANIVT